MAVSFVVRRSELERALRLDAEYYQPKHSIDFTKGSWLPIGDIVQTCQYGISRAMTEEPIGYAIFRMDDIKSGFLVDDAVKCVQIPEDVFKKCRLDREDLLFNRVNSEEFVGRTGIFRLGGEYVFASYLIRLRVKSSSPILPDYLNVFLNSSFGIRQIRKLSRRAVNQANVNAEELRSIKVAVLPAPAQKEVKRLCEESFSGFEASKALYAEAERMVLDGLGWETLDLSQPKWWAVALSRAREVERLDADHYQPKYAELIAHLKKTRKARPLGEIATYIKRGVQPRYVEGGEVIVVNSQHLGRYTLSMDTTARTDGRFWEENSRARIEKGDLLLYATGAPYVGRTNWYLDEVKAVGSNHVTILRTGRPMAFQGYLSVFLNSPAGMAQAAAYQKGSNQQELYPDDIARFVVHIAPEEVQARVAHLVTQSYEARQEARALFEEARRKVEGVIEGAAGAGQ